MRSLAAALVAGLLATSPAFGQLKLTGYGLGVASRAASSALAPAGSSWLGRTRLMVVGGRGATDVELAYEHVATRSPPGGGFSVTAPGGASARSGDWLGLDGSLRSTERTEWRHRLDRAAVSLRAGAFEVTLGRQAISWATTLMLTPADPFSPFDPSDPFREYRGGVDAVRVRAFAGPFSEIEAVVRPTESRLGTTLTALARFQTTASGWAFGGWAGALHDDPAAAAFATGAIGATAVRLEGSIREDPAGGSAVRGTVGVDRFLNPGGRDLYLVGELQYDGFGASSASKLLETVTSKPFVRGELQTLGQWTAAGQARYQVHPLISLDLLVLGDLSDGSVLVGPGLSWSASGSLSVRLGGFAGTGEEGRAGAPGSEYGAVPTLGYVALSWFF